MNGVTNKCKTLNKVLYEKRACAKTGESVTTNKEVKVLDKSLARLVFLFFVPL